MIRASSRWAREPAYLAEKWTATVVLDTTRTDQRNVPRTFRQSVNSDYRYFLGDQWFVNGGADFLSSDELQLGLRTTLAGGGGRYLIRTNRAYLSVYGGAGVVNENFLKEAMLPNNSDGVAVAGIDYNAFDIGDLSLLTSFKFLPKHHQYSTLPL